MMEVSSVIPFAAALVDIEYEPYFRHTAESWYLVDSGGDLIKQPFSDELEKAYQEYIKDEI